MSALGSQETLNYLAITILFFITWAYTLHPKWSFCIDDIDGVAKFSDRFHQEKDASGKITKEEKIDYYEDGEKRRWGNLQFNPTIGFPGCVMRFLRCNWGRRYKEIGKNSKGHSIYGFVQVAWKHHLLNLIVQYANCLLAYHFLSYLFGSKVALFATLLFLAHPISVMTTAWISGVNYALSMLGTLIALNVAIHINDLLMLLPSVGASSIFSVLMLLPGWLTGFILLFIGKNQAGIIYLAAGSIVFLHQAWIVSAYRKKQFIEQKMGKSTTIYPRKLFVMVKTYWYYVKMILVPKRLGLFHTFGYHFEDPLNYADRKFWFGLISLIACGVWFYFAPFPIRFGLLWFFLYLSIFSNLMTAMQFVSERYVYYPSLGFSVVIAYLLQDYPIAIAFILGIYVMRVWVHLPSFQNEVRFYESNVFNFPDSEVAMGNLGVAYLNHGMAHKAMDTWIEATRQNPLYDVPWYNLYSLFKQNGDILAARNYLQKCLNASTIHFPEQWQKEMDDIDKIIAQAISDGRIVRAPQALPPQ